MADNGNGTNRKNGSGDIDWLDALTKLTVLGGALAGVAGVKNSSNKKREKEELQRKLNEINYQLSTERNKFLFKDYDKINRLEAEKRKILQRLQELG